MADRASTLPVVVVVGLAGEVGVGCGAMRGAVVEVAAFVVDVVAGLVVVVGAVLRGVGCVVLGAPLGVDTAVVATGALVGAGAGAAEDAVVADVLLELDRDVVVARNGRFGREPESALVLSLHPEAIADKARSATNAERKRGITADCMHGPVLRLGIPRGLGAGPDDGSAGLAVRADGRPAPMAQLMFCATKSQLTRLSRNVLM